MIRSLKAKKKINQSHDNADPLSKGGRVAIELYIFEQQCRYFPSELVIRTVPNIKEVLDKGFTTVRDAGGADPGFHRAVSQWLIPRPKLFVSGRILSQTGGPAD